MVNMTTFAREFITVSDTQPRMRIMQWNILADSLAHSFPQVNPSYLTWEYRVERMLLEIQKFSPDIIGLQENDHYEDYFEPELSKLGYTGMFEKKTGWHKDGLSISWKTDKFTKVSQDLCKFPGNQFALIVQLDSELGRICVITTHLKARKEYDSIRCEQVSSLLNYIQQNLQELPIIICGDFNSLPDTGAYNAMLNNTCGLISGYRKALGEVEPVFTTLKIRNKMEIKTEDYIWLRGFTPISVLSLPRQEEIVYKSNINTLQLKVPLLKE